MPQPHSSDTQTAPRFRQIKDVLRRQIIDGALCEHAPLPSERMVAEEHNVSRMTARRALEALELEGLAYNENRRGRFVSPRRLSYDISQMISFAADAVSTGINLEIEVIDFGTCEADAKCAKQLGVAQGELLFKYTRLFRTSGHAIFLETEHVIASRFPDLLKHDLRQSTTQLLEQYYATRAQDGDVTIRMRGMHSHEAALLGLSENQAGIELEQVIRDTQNSPFCVGLQMWRGELAEFSARAIVNPTN